MAAPPLTPSSAPRSTVPPAGSGPPPYRTWSGERPGVTAWREEALTRATELAALARWLIAASDETGKNGLAEALFTHLELARSAAETRAGLIRSFTGSLYARAGSNIDAAEADLLQIAPPWYLRGQVPSLLRHVERHLPPSDRRLVELQRMAEQPDHADLSDADRGRIVAAYRAGSSAAMRENARVRSFRNVLSVTSVVLIVLAVAVAVAGLITPATVPLCFEPEAEARILVVCPTAQSEFVPAPRPETGLNSPDIDNIVADTAQPLDLLTVEVIGMLSAAVAAAAGLRNIRGTSTPFGLPVALAILKLPTGALTAFLGLLLMRGGFVPGLSALDTSAQILAWAIVFGYAQQLFTRLVDQQAHTVLDGVSGAERKSVPAAE